MPRVGQARRRDAHEAAIVEALEAAGCTILRLSGPGCPDLLVWFRGTWTPLEVKSKLGKLTPAQVQTWRKAGKIPVVRTVEEAWKALGIKAT